MAHGIKRHILRDNFILNSEYTVEAINITKTLKCF